MKPLLRFLARHWQEAALLVLFALPVLALLALGVLWLWQQGRLLEFSIAVSVAFVLGRLIYTFATPAKTTLKMVPAQPGAAEAERRARDALNGLIAATTLADVRSGEAAFDLATRTVRTVATAYYPGQENPEARVTVPELLLMAEDTARRLRQVLNAEFPLFNDIEIHLAASGVDWARAGWKYARIVQLLANPLSWTSVLVTEARGYLIGLVTSNLTDRAKLILATEIMREIGETLIKLYAGGYRKTAAELAASPAVDIDADRPVAADRPITILLAGQSNAGKSSLLNALAGDAGRVPAGRTQATDKFWLLAATLPEIGPVVFLDSPPVDQMPSDDWLEKADDADLILWVAAANRADRATDQKALRAVRRFARDDVTRPETPVILAATHADRLDPPLEWAPPYDVTSGNRPKERSMRAALAVIGRGLDVPADRRVILRTAADGAEPWNIDALRACLGRVLPEARQAQLDRLRRQRSVIDTVRNVGTTGAGVAKWTGGRLARRIGRLFSRKPK